MYIPAAFAEANREVLHGLMRAHSFATLVSVLEGELFATHLPLLLDADAQKLVGHVARPNPHWQAFQADAPLSLAIFQGPHAYVSPAWYAVEQAVPTWNYTTVHAYGRPVVIEDAPAVRAILERTVASFEGPRPEPWSTERLTDAYLSSMARGVVAFEMPILRLEGKR